MQNKVNLSALDADVVIDGDNVFITSNDGTATQIGIEEWKDLRESLRLDDIVDYKAGETPMTGYQFHIAVELTRQARNFKIDTESLKAE